jgi:hypothetical protein
MEAALLALIFATFGRNDIQKRDNVRMAKSLQQFYFSDGEERKLTRSE